MDSVLRLKYASYGVTPALGAAFDEPAPTPVAAAPATRAAPAQTPAPTPADARNAPPPAAAAAADAKSTKPAADKKTDKPKSDKPAAAKPAAAPKPAAAKIDRSKDPTALRAAEEGKKMAELMKNMTPEEKKKFRTEQKKAADTAAAAAAAAPKGGADKKSGGAAADAKSKSGTAAAGTAAAGEDSIDDSDVLVKVPKGTRDIKPEQMMVRERAFAMIKSVFQRHGAVQIDTPVFELKDTLTNKYGEDSKLIYELADQGGEILALRYDLTVPFARYLASYKVINIKRFHIGRVYRRDNPIMSRGRFREFYQCDFDIAGYESSPPMLPDAECLKVLSEILDSLPIGAYTIKLNHRKLLDAIMAVSGVPEDKFRPICSAIDKLDKESWETVEKEMVGLKGLDPKAAAKIGTYVGKKGEPFALLAVLEADASLSKNKSAVEAFAELRAMCEFMKAFGMLNRITLDMSLARGLDYYTGVIYEAVLLQSAPSAKDQKSATATATAAAAAGGEEPINLGSIAAGGRYDGLVGMFSGKAVPAVGVSVGIERIFNLLEEVERKRGPIRKNHTQVLLCSAGKDMLLHKLTLANELWKANIATEFAYAAAPKPKDQITTASKELIPVTIFIGADEIKKGEVTVKDMRGQHEWSADEQAKNHGVAVKRTDLVAYLTKLFASAPATASRS